MANWVKVKNWKCPPRTWSKPATEEEKKNNRLLR